LQGAGYIRRLPFVLLPPPAPNPSSTGALVFSHPYCHQSGPSPWEMLVKECVSIFGSNFALRCFQCLSLGAWLHGLPCRTAVKLEAPARCSSRTRRTLPSNTQQNL